VYQEDYLDTWEEALNEFVCDGLHDWLVREGVGGRMKREDIIDNLYGAIERMIVRIGKVRLDSASIMDVRAQTDTAHLELLASLEAGCRGGNIVVILPEKRQAFGRRNADELRGALLTQCQKTILVVEKTEPIAGVSYQKTERVYGAILQESFHIVPIKEDAVARIYEKKPGVRVEFRSWGTFYDIGEAV